ncbi:hypothetical protein vseg_008249 [Gypsophila vaccaria]
MGDIVMNNYNDISKDEYFDGDIEKGEVNAKLGSNDSDCGPGFGVLSQKHDERAVSLVISSSDEDAKSLRVTVVDEGSGGGGGDVERKVVKEKPKKMSAKKPPKPPRPPRGLSLDSADQKLIRELHEIARLKRARVERMKALKKAKETKAGSSKNQLFATLLTVLFCLVLLLQGISSRSSVTTSTRGSPFSSELAQEHNHISVRHHPLSSTAKLGHRRDPKSPRPVEQAFGVDTTEQVRKADG